MIAVIKNIAFASILVLLGTQCGSKQPSAPDAAASHETPPASTIPEGQIHLTSAQKAQAGIETGSFVQRPLAGYLPVTAELMVSKEHTATVSAFTDGLLTELRVNSQQMVQKGAVIAVLRKPDLIDLQQQFLENSSQLEFLQAEYNRYKTLKDADATATKNFSKAASELRSAQTTDKILSAKLRQYQINPEQLTPENIRTELVLTAPISGTVTQILANTGTALTQGAAVCEIADLSRLHPVLYVLEKDLFLVREGQQAALYFPGEPGRTYSATVYQMERNIDPARKTARVHARMSGPAPAHFAAGAYMDARLMPGAGSNVAALPSDAVIREGAAEYIFIFEKEDTEGATFRKVAVKTGASADGYTAVTPVATLPPDTKIVVKGAYYVSAQGAGVSAEE